MIELDLSNPEIPVIDYDDYNTDIRKIIHFKHLNIKDLYRLGKYKSNEANIPLSYHIHPDCFEISYTYSGSQRYYIGKNKYQLDNEKNTLITFPNVIHGTGCEILERSHLYYFIFECLPTTKNFMGLDDVDSDFIVNFLYSIDRYSFKLTNQAKTILDSIMHIYFSNEPMKRSRILGLMTEFFYRIYDDYTSYQSDIPYDIKEVTEYIEINCHLIDSTCELSKISKLSTTRLNSKFKSYMGITPHDYLIKCRIELSKDMLLYTTFSITQIACELNFSSSQHFATMFKKHTRLTPGEFKRLNHA